MPPQTKNDAPVACGAHQHASESHLAIFRRFASAVSLLPLPAQQVSSDLPRLKLSTKYHQTDSLGDSWITLIGAGHPTVRQVGDTYVSQQDEASAHNKNVLGSYHSVVTVTDYQYVVNVRHTKGRLSVNVGIETLTNVSIIGPHRMWRQQRTPPFACRGPRLSDKHKIRFLSYKNNSSYWQSIRL